MLTCEAVLPQAERRERLQIADGGRQLYACESVSGLLVLQTCVPVSSLELAMRISSAFRLPIVDGSAVHMQMLADYWYYVSAHL